MKNTYSLHQLIHKLSKSEKRAFSLYIKRYNSVKNQKSKKLFDLINKMETYNEEELLSVSTKKTLSYNLHKLHKLLIDALSSFHFKSDSDSPGEIINCIELGFKYELAEMVEGGLKRGYAIADKTGNLGFRLHLNFYDEKLLKSKRKLNSLLSIYDKQSETSRQLVEQTHYKKIWGEVLSWYKRNLSKAVPEELVFSEDVLYELFFENKESAFDLLNGNCYFMARSMYFEINRDFEKDIENEEKNLALLLNNLDRVEPNKVCTVYFNLIRSYLSVFDFEKAEQKLQCFKDFSEKYTGDEFNDKCVQSICFYVSILYHHVKEEPTAIINSEEEIDRLVKENGDRLNLYVSKDRIEGILMMVVFAFLRKREFDKCLKWIDKAKVETDVERLMVEYKFLEFFCHYELGNERLLNSFLNSIDYFIETKERNSNYRELHRIARLLVNQQEFEVNFEIPHENNPFSFIYVIEPYLIEKQKVLSFNKEMEYD